MVQPSVIQHTLEDLQVSSVYYRGNPVLRMKAGIIQQLVDILDGTNFREKQMLNPWCRGWVGPSIFQKDQRRPKVTFYHLSKGRVKNSLWGRQGAKCPSLRHTVPTAS